MLLVTERRIIRMAEILTNTSVTFAHPFSLPGFEGAFPAGTYAVETTEEPLNGLTFVAHRRTQTTIELPSTWLPNARQLSEIDPADLEAALAADAAKGNVLP
jgi:hypothetical protein